MSDELAGELAALEALLWATEGARRLALASLMLLIFEYTITLDKEIKHFWSGSWSLSRILYLSNRYFPFAPLTLGAICFYLPNLSSDFCDKTIKIAFSLTVLCMAIIQAILVLRVWFIFPRSPFARSLCVGIFIACTAASVTTLFLSFADVEEAVKIPGLRTLGCAVPPPANLWHMFVPPFFLHTVLFLFTAARAIKTPQSLNKAPLMKRLLLDGGFFYIVVFFSVGFSGIGALLTDVPVVNIPAIYSNFMLSITSICISRVMLSIRSLAASLSTDPDWLLNYAELTRLDWKRGRHDGEILVDVDAVEGVDIEMDDANIHKEMLSSPKSHSFTDTRRTTCIGLPTEISPYHGDSGWF